MVEEKVSADQAANSKVQWSDIYAGPLGLMLLVCGYFYKHFTPTALNVQDSSGETRALPTPQVHCYG